MIHTCPFLSLALSQFAVINYQPPIRLCTAVATLNDFSTLIHNGSVLKRDRDWKFRLRSGPGGIGIGNFNLGRDRAGSGFDRDPECLNIFRGKKLLCEVLKINFENHKYS